MAPLSPQRRRGIHQAVAALAEMYCQMGLYDEDILVHTIHQVMLRLEVGTREDSLLVAQALAGPARPKDATAARPRRGDLIADRLGLTCPQEEVDARSPAREILSRVSDQLEPSDRPGPP